jgi:hypothetical protein
VFLPVDQEYMHHAVVLVPLSQRLWIALHLNGKFDPADVVSDPTLTNMLFEEKLIYSLLFQAQRSNPKSGDDKSHSRASF